DERRCDHIDALLQSEFKIIFVLFRERGYVDGSPGQIDAFVFAEDPAIDHFALDVVVLNIGDAKLNQPVGKQNTSTRLDLVGQTFERGRDRRCGPAELTRRDAQAGPAFQNDGRVVFQSSGPNLGALQVLQNANRATGLFRDAAHALDHPQMFFMRPMRKVETSHVHSQAHQVAQGGFRVAGGPQGAYDLRSPTAARRVQF